MAGRSLRVDAFQKADPDMASNTLDGDKDSSYPDDAPERQSRGDTAAGQHDRRAPPAEAGMSASNESGMSDRSRAHLVTCQATKAAHPSGRPDPVASHRMTGSRDTAENLDKHPTPRILLAYQKYGKQYVDMLRRDPQYSERLRKLCDNAEAFPDLMPDFQGYD